MIKIVFSEVGAPLTVLESIDLNSSSAVRAVNTSSKPAQLFLVDENGLSKSITLVGSESLILKKHSLERVYASSKNIFIAGVSIY
jgi:hypothetical protein